MQQITNKTRQSITFVGNKGQNVTALLVHLGSKEGYLIRDITNFNAVDFNNGMYSCSIIDTDTHKVITNFLVKLIDKKELTLKENNTERELYYPKNR